MDCLHLPCLHEGPVTRPAAYVLGTPGSMVLCKGEKNLSVSCALPICVYLIFICAFGHDCTLDLSSGNRL